MQNQCGRSMIEMLGVLAIIGVLSVGGIAGYSKAMKQFKINKMLSQYSDLTFNVIENYSSLINSYADITAKNSELYNTAKSLNWIPDNWKPYYKSSNTYLDDGNNNLLHFFMRYDQSSKKRHVIMDITIGKSVNNLDSTTESATDVCLAFFNMWIKQLSGVIWHAGVYSTNWKQAKSKYFYGNSFCGGNNKCLSSMTMNDAYELCHSCQEDQKECYIAIGFPEY